jgi:hypothetical protein
MLIIYFILFLVISTIAFSLPGFYLLSKIKIDLNFWEKYFFGTIVGFVVYTFASYTLLVFNVNYLIIPLYLALSIYILVTFKIDFGEIKFLKRERLFLLLCAFTIGIAGQLAVISPSGILTSRGLLFWSSHGHDASWHIALMDELKRGYPLQNPTMAGEKLVNYHFFSDIAASDFNYYLKIPSLDLYFRFFPLIFSLLLGTSAYFLGKRLGKSYAAGLGALFFTYFAGSFGYIATWIKNKSIGGESLFFATQVQSSSGNPPQIISNFMFLAFLFFLFIYLKSKDRVLFFILTILASTLVMFKVYASLVLFAGLGLISLYSLIKERRKDIVFLLLLSALISGFLYIPNTKGSASFLIFEPGWYLRSMIVSPSRLNWTDLELRRQTYIFEKNWKRVIEIEVIAFIIFFIGNLGMRFIGLLKTPEIIKNISKNYFYLFISMCIAGAFIFPLLFLQKGVAGNTAQTLQYFLLIIGILAGLATSDLLTKIKNKALSTIFIIFLIILSIPTQIGLLQEFYGRNPFAKITIEELSALEYLRSSTAQNSVILTPPYDKRLNLKEGVPPIWDWFDTAYVSAFSQRRTYFSDYEQADIMGYQYEDRLNLQTEIFNTPDVNTFKQMLEDTKASYLYFPKIIAPKVNLDDTNLSLFYSNNEIEIWEVK